MMSAKTITVQIVAHIALKFRNFIILNLFRRTTPWHTNPTTT